MAKITDDTLALRFKYGIHTVFLSVDPLTPFSTISEDLLDVLRECYPDGLTVSVLASDRTQVPVKGEEYRVFYALPKNPKDLSYGWKPLNINGSQTPASLKLKDNAALAFQIQTSEMMEEEPFFEVAIPTQDEEDAQAGTETVVVLCLPLEKWVCHFTHLHMSGSTTLARLRLALLLLLPLSAVLTTYLYLYPVIGGCAFPLPQNDSDSGNGSRDGADQAAFLSTARQHLPAAPTAAGRLAPFRLLALGDPQLEGDTSIPNAHGDSFPHLVRAMEHAMFRSSGLSLRGRIQQTLHDLVDFWFEDVPNTACSVRKRIDLVGNDFYLAHIYRTMRWWARPTHVAVLGDLLGSQWVADDEFEKRAHRYWHRVVRGGRRVSDSLALYPADEYALSGYLGGFVSKNETSETNGTNGTNESETDDWSDRIINVAGNHDIGYAGDITEERLGRFERAFGKANYELRFELPLAALSGNASEHDLFDRETNPWSNRLVPELRIVNLNDMNLDTPALSAAIQDQTYGFINAVINTASAVEFRGHFTVVLTHVPLYKPAGTCVDEPYFAFGPDDDGGLLAEQNQLSADASRGFLEGIFGMHGDPGAPAGGRGRVGVILNGHDHEGCDTFHYVNQSQGPVWEAVRWDAATNKTIVGRAGFPGVREITVRSMMGDYGGNAGLLSAWFDEAAWEWRFDFATCALGRQHLWWVVHVLDVLVLAAVLVYGLARLVETAILQTPADFANTSSTPTAKMTVSSAKKFVAAGTAKQRPSKAAT
ncbi:hypothetical protein CMQ_6007 [Grosmannia clavigera kw1407]|uniref:Polarized growth protein n=1 Tax=Grosmannia clavigera (strain kw1407 / UAMH 11150) TaxID=655863 RepID=F0XMQ9_GROCL|nr:uncharacterized protein CMQ_6007 [Grosmannia clavigera kw1407]EFX01065.1 hypothetical protein CMQ_6007 [Grosmannia clavigera kw1407]